MLWMLMACGETEPAAPAPIPDATGPLDATYTQLVWHTRAELEATEATKAAAELREPKPTSAWVGTVQVISKRRADPDDYLVIVRDATGKELLRKEGEGEAMRRSSELDDEWTVILAFGSVVQGAPPWRVYLVDTRFATRQEWEVSLKDDGKDKIVDLTKQAASAGD